MLFLAKYPQYQDILELDAAAICSNDKPTLQPGGGRASRVSFRATSAYLWTTMPAGRGMISGPDVHNPPYPPQEFGIQATWSEDSSAIRTGIWVGTIP